MVVVVQVCACARVIYRVWGYGGGRKEERYQYHMILHEKKGAFAFFGQI